MHLAASYTSRIGACLLGQRVKVAEVAGKIEESVEKNEGRDQIRGARSLSDANLKQFPPGRLGKATRAEICVSPQTGDR